MSHFPDERQLTSLHTKSHPQHETRHLIYSHDFRGVPTRPYTLTRVQLLQKVISVRLHSSRLPVGIAILSYHLVRETARDPARQLVRVLCDRWLRIPVLVSYVTRSVHTATVSTIAHATGYEMHRSRRVVCSNGSESHPLSPGPSVSRVPLLSHTNG